MRLIAFEIIYFDVIVGEFWQHLIQDKLQVPKTSPGKFLDLCRDCVRKLLSPFTQKLPAAIPGNIFIQNKRQVAETSPGKFLDLCRDCVR